MKHIELRKFILYLIAISIFIILYLLFILFFFIIPKDFNISIILIIGILTLIVGFFLFINLNQIKETNFEFKFISENSIKLILTISMSITLLIEPISTPETIILWEDVGFLNYIRAILFIIGCSFLPGASLYSIIFLKEQLHDRFKVESFILKITIYPLISFSFIGISVLILDQLGFVRNSIATILFLLIIGLVIMDILIQYIRKEFVIIKYDTITFSKFTLIILIFSLGFILMSLGIHFGMQYLVPGDSWVGLAANNYIGQSNTSPIEWGKINANYPIFWSYISYGFSVLCGLPYFNTNALLGPFCYLFVTSVYLLMKAVLFDYNEKYVILSTILTLLFSELFYITYDLSFGISPGIIVVENFFFKSYAFILYFIVIALFIILLRTSSSIHKNEFIIFKDIKLIILISFFLVISFSLYLLPLLSGFMYIFLYCLISNEKKKNFQYLLLLILFMSIIYIILDLVMEFYLSSSLIFLIPWFFQNPIFNQIFEFIPSYLMVYFSLLALLTVNYIIYFIISRKLKIWYMINLKYKLTSKTIFIFFYTTFSVFLIIEIITIILDEFLLINLINKYIFFYYIHLIFWNIGYIGIFAAYLTHFCFKKDRLLFSVLMLWIFYSFLISSVIIFSFWIQSNSLLLNSINNRNRFVMYQWFSRNWYYSIFAISILASIGIIEFINMIRINPKFRWIFRNNFKYTILRYATLYIFIYLSFTNFFLWGIRSGNKNYRINDEQVELFIWMSENIPNDSNILLNEKDFVLQKGLFSIANGREYFIKDVFEDDVNETKNIAEIDYLRDHEIEYLLIHEDYLSETSDRAKFTRRYLIPNFYNESEYETDHYRLYYAPYFD